MVPRHWCRRCGGTVTVHRVVGRESTSTARRRGVLVVRRIAAAANVHMLAGIHSRVDTELSARITGIALITWITVVTRVARVARVTNVAARVSHVPHVAWVAHIAWVAHARVAEVARITGCHGHFSGIARIAWVARRERHFPGVPRRQRQLPWVPRRQRHLPRVPWWHRHFTWVANLGVHFTGVWLTWKGHFTRVAHLTGVTHLPRVTHLARVPKLARVALTRVTARVTGIPALIVRRPRMRSVRWVPVALWVVCWRWTSVAKGRRVVWLPVWRRRSLVRRGWRRPS